MPRWPKARLAITVTPILTLSILLAGCASPDESLPNDNGALSLAAMEFSCGAGHFPAAALSECVRGVLAAGHTFPVGSLVVLLAWALGAPVAAIRFFRWEE